MSFIAQSTLGRIIILAILGLSAVYAPPAVAQQDSTSSAESSSTEVSGWPSHAHDAQHSARSSVAAQPLSNTHWSTPVDLHPEITSGEILIHYGSPLVTPANTVIVPVKTGKNSFRVEAHNGSNGSLIWTQGTSYQAPSAAFTPSFSPVLHGNKLFVPDGGGTVLVRENPDQADGKVTRLVFYGAQNFNEAPRAYNENIQINTPITADANGDVYFGFLVIGSTPIELQSGLAKITAAGNGSWISATFATGDINVQKVNMNCAPALSLDGRTLYVGMDTFDFGYGYLLALNSTTLQPINVVRLTDPWSGLDSTITDETSATPTVGPDGDVYFGVLENPFPSHNDRGWLLHFNGDLTQIKIPGSFGWDDTASVVDASLVPSYHGSSSYLLMTKYNNYAGIGTGDGVNKLAVLDPNAPMEDLVFKNVSVMKDVLTIKGVTPDPNFPTFPHAVREWCINTAAVDPATKSILANSEDGTLYRWDLVGNKFSQRIPLTSGIGEAYTPTIIGSDGTAYAINDAILFAIGH
jgi:hypothetical protein